MNSYPLFKMQSYLCWAGSSVVIITAVFDWRCTSFIFVLFFNVVCDFSIFDFLVLAVYIFSFSCQACCCMIYLVIDFFERLFNGVWVLMECNKRLSRILLRGFKSIKDCDLELQSLNIMIGPNRVGKSNFLSFFRLMQ